MEAQIFAAVVQPGHLEKVAPPHVDVGVEDLTAGRGAKNKLPVVRDLVPLKALAQHLNHHEGTGIVRMPEGVFGPFTVSHIVKLWLIWINPASKSIAPTVSAII